MLPPFFYCGDYCLLPGVFLTPVAAPSKCSTQAAFSAEKFSKHISGVGFKLLNFLIPSLPLARQETVRLLMFLQS